MLDALVSQNAIIDPYTPRPRSEVVPSKGVVGRLLGGLVPRSGFELQSWTVRLVESSRSSAQERHFMADNADDRAVCPRVDVTQPTRTSSG